MKSRSFLAPVAILACLSLAIPAVYADGTARPGFGKKHPFRAEELPEGKLKTRLQSLNPQAKQKAMNWLHTFDFDGCDAAEHLRVDDGGGIFIVCPEEKGESGSIAPLPGQSTALPAAGLAAVAVSAPPSYHSRPNATRRIYLDFNGGTVSGTAWNSSAGVTSWNVKAWSQDSDTATYNDAEQAWMKRVWQRVSEDYAPFDIDVTTDTSFDPVNYTGNKDNVGWVLICETTDNNGVALPHAGSGGVAYLGVFGNSTYSPTYQPAWVTSTNGGGDESVIAEAASHEMGHNMGLSHDGTSTLAYYGGHGSGDISWGPLMGTGYYRNVSQWSKGEYFDANQLQDDLATISGRVPYRTDDQGGTAATATPLTVTGGNTITSTTPDNDPSNANPVNKGVIERNTDVDVFSFYTGAGNVQLNANPWIQPAGTRGGNLDILLELYDQAGTLVASNNGVSVTNASVSATLAQGYYYLYVRNTGTGTPTVSAPSGYTAYGSIGQYFISGTVVGATPPPALTSITPTSGSANTIASVDISGSGISTSTSFKLRKSGQSDIPASSVATVGSILRCQFNLTGAASGAWDVVATNPDSQTSILAAAFTVIGTIWTENFDGTITGWTSQATTGSNSWNLTTAQSQSPATSYFAAGPGSRSTTSLVSPGISIPAAATGLQLKFWHNYNFQTNRDGGRLEFSIDNGAWFDVLDSGSGASFTAGGYTTTISSMSSDFNGLRAWNGNSGGFVSTVVDLTDTAKFAGKSLKIRWRLATNSSTASAGWYVDSVALLGSVPPSNQAPVIAAAANSTSTEILTDPDSSIHQIIRGVFTSLSLAATDDGGEPALIYHWAAVNPQNNLVNFSENDTNSAKNVDASFSTAGDYQITASVQDAQGLTATSMVNLRVVQTDSGLVVTPPAATIAVGANQPFTAMMLDQFGIAMSNQPSSISWTASGGGSVDASGVFTASSVGNPFLVTATSGVHSGAATVTVIPGAASVTLTGLDQTYDGTPRVVAASTVPAGIGVSFSYNGSSTAPTHAGTYAVTAAINDPNYTGSTSGTLIIQKAAASIELTGLNQIFDGTPKTIAASTDPAGLGVSLSYDGSSTAPNHAGTYAVTAVINDPNYTGSTSGALIIQQAKASVEITGLNQTYDGSSKSASVTTLPANLEFSITYGGSTTAPTAAGDYPITVTITDTNHTGTASGLLAVAKASPVITISNLLQTYDGTPKSATVVTIPGDLPVLVTYTGSPTAAGIYPLSASVDDANYAGSASGSLVIEKAPASIVLAGLSQVHDGSVKAVTVSTTPENLPVSITYDGATAAPTAIGTYTIAATIIDPNHTGSSTGTLSITPGNDWVSWQFLQFTESEITAGLAADSADPDSDGLANLAEYALGTDPHAFTPPFSATVDETSLSFTFTRPSGLPGITYAAEFSDDATIWSPATLETLAPGPTDTIKASAPVAPDEPHRRFLRLRFERQ